MSKNVTKPSTQVRARCLLCEYDDSSMLAEQVAERHAAISGHSIEIVKTQQYVIRGEK